MVRNGKIEISLGGIGKFFGVLLAGSALLVALGALAVMPFGAYDTDRHVTAAQNGDVVIVDMTETPGFVADLFVDAKDARYVRTARKAWFSYETGRPVSNGDDLERAYQGYLLRQQAEEVLARAGQPKPESIEVSTPAPEADATQAPVDEASSTEGEN